MIDRDEYIKSWTQGQSPFHEKYNNQAKALFKRIFYYIDENYPWDMVDGQKITMLVRMGKHFGHASSEHLLTNVYDINPLADLGLYQIDINEHDVQAQYFIYAYIYERFLPELSDVKFDSGKKIPKFAKDICHVINKKYPRRKYEDMEEFKIIGSPLFNYVLSTNSEVQISRDQINENVFARCQNEQIAGAIKNLLSPEFYEFSLNKAKNGEFDSYRDINKGMSAYMLANMLNGLEPLTGKPE